MGSWCYGFYENEQGELVLGEISTGSSKYLPSILLCSVSLKEFKKFKEAEKQMLIEDLTGAVSKLNVVTKKQMDAVMKNWKPEKLDPKDFVSVEELMVKLKKKK